MTADQTVRLTAAAILVAAAITASVSLVKQLAATFAPEAPTRVAPDSSVPRSWSFVTNLLGKVPMSGVSRARSRWVSRLQSR